MRRASILLGLAGAVIPFGGACLATFAFYRQADAEGIYVCGLPALGYYLLAAVTCVSTSAVACGLGLVAYRRLPRPRPRRRVAELAALALPWLVVCAYAASFFLES